MEQQEVENIEVKERGGRERRKTRSRNNSNRKKADDFSPISSTLVLLFKFDGLFLLVALISTLLKNVFFQVKLLLLSLQLCPASSFDDTRMNAGEKKRNFFFIAPLFKV